jgi:hypothetical protein
LRRGLSEPRSPCVERAVSGGVAQKMFWVRNLPPPPTLPPPTTSALLPSAAAVACLWLSVLSIFIIWLVQRWRPSVFDPHGVDGSPDDGNGREDGIMGGNEFGGGGGNGRSNSDAAKRPAADATCHTCGESGHCSRECTQLGPCGTKHCPCTFGGACIFVEASRPRNVKNALGQRVSSRVYDALRRKHRARFAKQPVPVLPEDALKIIWGNVWVSQAACIIQHAVRAAIARAAGDPWDLPGLSPVHVTYDESWAPTHTRTHHHIITSSPCRWWVWSHHQRDRLLWSETAWQAYN